MTDTETGTIETRVVRRDRSVLRGAVHRSRRTARGPGPPPAHPRRLREHRHAVPLLLPAGGAVRGPDVPAARGRARRPRGRLRRADGRADRRPRRCPSASAATWSSRTRATSATTIDAEGGRRPDALRLPRQRRGRAVLQARRRAGLRQRARTTRTCAAAAGAGAARRCASRTPPTCGTARCRSWAAATSTTTATPSASRARRPWRSRSMFNVQRLLGDEDRRASSTRMAPGGSGDPFAGLTTHEREELASLYRLGYPRGDEFMIAPADGPDLAVDVDRRHARTTQDPTYFDDFWTKPGYVGHDLPDARQPATSSTCTATGRARAHRRRPPRGPDVRGPGVRPMRALVGRSWRRRERVRPSVRGRDRRAARRLPPGRRRARHQRRRPPAVSCTAWRRRRRLLLRRPGRGQHPAVQRRATRATRCTSTTAGSSRSATSPATTSWTSCSSTRCASTAGPIYPQHPVPLMSPLMGVSYSGQYKGKLIWVHHTHDASLWPPQGVVYDGCGRASAQGATGAAEKFRLRWTENAEHVPPMMIPVAARARQRHLAHRLPADHRAGPARPGRLGRGRHRRRRHDRTRTTTAR